MDEGITVFIDSNILFSACYKVPNQFELFWVISSIKIVTAAYCITEVRRNLRSQSQLARLDTFLEQTLIVEDCPEPELPTTLMLPSKDVPVLAAAANARASLLVTGDLKHFSRYFGHVVMGVLIESPVNFRKRFPEVFKED